MLVCQRENGVDVVYSDPDGFGCPGTMDLWDLHSPNTLSQAKMQLTSSLVDANFCPLCSFWSTNNETLNNHICKHYRMGLTCPADGFMMASVAVMKSHMETEHGYKAKCGGQAKKAKERLKQHLARCCLSTKLLATSAHPYQTSCTPTQALTHSLLTMP